MALTGTKDWSQSKTIIGIIVAAVTLIASATGHTINAELADQLSDVTAKGLTVVSDISAFVSAAAMLYAAIKRLTATQKIAPTVLSPTPPKGK